MSDNTVSFGDLMNEAKTAAVLPAGEYAMRVTKCDMKIASTGKLMNVAELTVMSGAHTNRKVWNNFVLVTDNPRALRMFFINMAAFGLDDAYFKTMNGMGPEQAMRKIAIDLTGRSAMVSLDHREYNNAPTENITKIKPYHAGPQGVGAPVMNTGINVQGSVHSPIPQGGAPAGIPAAVVLPAPGVVASAVVQAPIAEPVAPPTPPPPAVVAQTPVVPISEPVQAAHVPTQEAAPVTPPPAEAATIPVAQPVGDPPPPPVIF